MFIFLILDVYVQYILFLIQLFSKGNTNRFICYSLFTGCVLIRCSDVFDSSG